jgi:hypothetical protein
MTTTTNTRTFWGSFVVRNSKGQIVERGELYSNNGVFPEHAIMRVAARHSKNCLVKFLPGVRLVKAE